MSGRAVASTMPPGAWAGTAATGRGPRGEATVGSAVARPLEVAGGRSFQSPPPCRGLRSRRGRRRVTLAASLLFALILVAGKGLSERFSRFSSFVKGFFPT